MEEQHTDSQVVKEWLHLLNAGMWGEPEWQFMFVRCTPEELDAMEACTLAKNTTLEAKSLKILACFLTMKELLEMHERVDNFVRFVEAKVSASFAATFSSSAEVVKMLNIARGAKMAAAVAP